MIPVVLGAFAFLGIVPRDPAPGLFRSREESRTFECERLFGEVAESERIGEVKTPRGRRLGESDVLSCRQWLLDPDLRDPGDEAILRELGSRTGRVAAELAASQEAGRTWLVEAFTVNPVVGTKVAFAAKSALLAERLSVSDRVPLLSASDLEVITNLPPARAYPVACARWYAAGQLRDTDALLAMVTRDRRETNLHPGICVEGRWTWLR